MSIPGQVVLCAGRPGTDYPVLGKVPYTNFYCDDQPYPGFFADVETRCQAWHYCDIDGRQATFLCPNGTQFSQIVFVCDWWFNVRCELSPKLYVINSRLYGKPTEDPTRPHRVITKELLENIFVKRK
ncbi:U-scoloptoxin(01)-Cw1a-like [Polistes fuscatus]|uniref:U-scoloptoxin(01)-Cw1a-like n=1 Tax=Polistes fuscatus TaxID=30207 RepID=UPI001CA94844|nr:U-scoloptoxin(01)-Cw1a-like [Polistes fuscatus]